MKNQTLFNQLKKSSQKFLLIFSCLLAFISGWTGNWTNTASATIIENNVPLIAEFDNSGVGNQVEGIGKQIEGSTQKQFGKAQSKVEDAAQNAKENASATTKQLNNNSEETVGKTQNTLENAGNQIQNTAESVIDSIKDFFKQ